MKRIKLGNLQLNQSGNFFANMSKLIINNRKYESRTYFNFENFFSLFNFFEDFIAGVSHRSSSLDSRLDANCLKTFSRHYRLSYQNRGEVT